MEKNQIEFLELKIIKVRTYWIREPIVRNRSEEAIHPEDRPEEIIHRRTRNGETGKEIKRQRVQSEKFYKEKRVWQWQHKKK